MRTTSVACTILIALLAAPAGLPAQPAAAPLTRIFAGPVDQLWDVTQSVLKSLGWSIDEKDKATGWILTDSRSVDFRDFGVYGDGTRHKLRLTVKAAGEGRTAVSVERELYREERILWMKERKPLQATDRNAEVAVLDGIERTVPAVLAAAPVPTPPAAPPAPPSPPVAATRPGSSRGEFTYKVTYRVKGTSGGAVLTYRNAMGGTEQASVRLPWELSFDAKGGSFLYVSAQNQGVLGSVTCEILLDDESRTTSTSSGAYVIAECSNAAERN